MNTRKQVLLMSALLLVMLIIAGIYAAWYPNRSRRRRRALRGADAPNAAPSSSRATAGSATATSARAARSARRLPAAPALDRPTSRASPTPRRRLQHRPTSAPTRSAVSDGAKFKAGQTILIDEERMEVKAVDGNTLTRRARRSATPRLRPSRGRRTDPAPRPGCPDRQDEADHKHDHLRPRRHGDAGLGPEPGRPAQRRADPPAHASDHHRHAGTSSRKRSTNEDRLPAKLHRPCQR